MREGEQFLHEEDPKLHISPPIEKTQERLGAKGKKISQKPAEKIGAYLERFQNILNPPKVAGTDFDRKERNINLLKRGLYKNIVIKPEDIPESYWDLQRRIIVDEGRSGDFEKDEGGKIIIPDEVKEQSEQVLISDQEKSLDRWIDYLTSSDADVYPMWAKYWAFQSMAKMGKLEKKDDGQGNETARFQKRTPGTVAAFPPLNPRALAMTIGVITERAREKVKPRKERKPTGNKSVKLDDAQFQELLSTENFSKIYSQFLIEMPEYSTEGLKEIRGEWIKYDQGSKPDKLVESLEGHPLEWCTANPDTAKTQLQGGDFWVYYSYGKNDKPDNPTIPRIAIRMEGQNKIAEVRGIAADQNFDPYIAPVLDKKLKEFGHEGKQYQKASADMKKLTVIGEKIGKDQKLTKEDLIFLYEMDSQIDGFGYQKDPRIKELRDQRNPKEDMLVIFECQSEQIATRPQEITKDTKAYVGKLEPGVFELVQIYNIEHIYTSFPEARIRRQELEIGGKTAEDLERELREKGINISDYALDMLKKMRKNKNSIQDKDSIPLENPENISLVRLTVKDLGFANGATTQEIYKKAEELGLELCPAEVGPHLRLQYTNQPLNEWIFIGMKQIYDRDTDPDVFDLERDADGLWLSGRWARPGRGWLPARQFAFRLRKSA